MPPRKPPKVEEPAPPPPAAEKSVVRGFWSGNISFGLVSIPVSLISARRSHRASLRPKTVVWIIGRADRGTCVHRRVRMASAHPPTRSA